MKFISINSVHNQVWNIQWFIPKVLKWNLEVFFSIYFCQNMLKNEIYIHKFCPQSGLTRSVVHSQGVGRVGGEGLQLWKINIHELMLVHPFTCLLQCCWQFLTSLIRSWKPSRKRKRRSRSSWGRGTFGQAAATHEDQCQGQRQLRTTAEGGKKAFCGTSRRD